MNGVFVVCLLLQAVYAERNISISIGTPQESPAGVTYVEGKAPEELKAGPAKNSTKLRERINPTPFIHSSSRDIPKDDEIENEEFERFIKKHHNRPTIETVFVSSSPSPLYAEESEEFNEESSSLKPQAEFFKSPSENQTFERSVAHPTLSSSILPLSDHGYFHRIVNHQPPGGDGILVQADGGQYSAFTNGQYLPSYPNFYSGGEQQYYQLAQPIPSGAPAVVGVPGSVPGTINVAQRGLKTKTYEIRRPAIQKHYYDIEERVIIRPAGSIVVELNRPVAKIPTGETIFALGGLEGGFPGAGFQQSQGAIDASQAGLQGGFTGIGLQQGAIGIIQGAPQGGFTGVGVQQSQGGLGYSTIFATPASPFGIGGISEANFQQSQEGVLQGGLQGGFTGVGTQQSQGGIILSTPPSPANGGSQGGIAGAGFQQSQGGIGVSQGGPQGGFVGVGTQQSQGGIILSTPPSPANGGSQGGGVAGAGFQQSQGSIGVSQGGPQGGFAGVGIQQTQGGVISSTPPSIAIGGSQGGVAGAGFQQSQGGIGVSQGGPQGGFTGVGIQQSQGGVVSSTPSSIAIGGSQGGVAGAGFQQSQGTIGVSQGVPQGGFVGTGFQQSPSGTIYTTTLTSFNPSATPTTQTVFGGSQGGFSGAGIQQSQGGVSYSTTFATPTSAVGNGGSQGVVGGAGFQQSQGAIGVSQGGQQGGAAGVGIQQSQSGSQGGIIGAGFQQSQAGVGVSQGGQQGGGAGVGIQQSQGGIIYSTTAAPYFPPAAPTPTVAIGGSQGGLQGGFSGAGFQQSQGGISYSTTLSPPTSPVGIEGVSGTGFQQSQGSIGVAQGGPQGGFAGVGIQQSQGAIGVSQGGQQGGAAGVGIQQSQGGISYSTTAAPYLPPAPPTPTVAIGGSQGGFAGAGFQQSQGGISYSTTLSPPTSPVGIGGVSGIGFQQSQGAIGVSQGGPQGGFSGVDIQQSQGGYLPPGSGIQQPASSSYPLPLPPRRLTPRPQQPYPSVSTTTAGSANAANNDDSVIVEASSNVQNRGTFSSTTTTERSFTSSVNQDASAYARGSLPGSVSRNITPFMIAVGEPDFHYPPYVEINSNGSPLGHLQRIQATSQPYPRMRYQGQLLIGEVQQPGYGALSQNTAQQNVYESPAYVAEIPPNNPYEEQSIRNAQASSFEYQQPGEINGNTQYQQQFVGSSQQPLQVAQISGSAHQQPAQIYQHHFIRANSQPVQITEIPHQQHVSEVTQHPIHVARYRSRTFQPAQVYQISQQPLHDAPIHQQHAAQYRSRTPQKTNLVAQIRHQQQHATQVTQQPIQDAQTPNSNPDQTVTQVTQQPIEVESSTHQQPSHPNYQYQYQAVSTTQQPEAYTTGQRLYQQNAFPSKYTQHHTINVAPSQHTIFFNNHQQQTKNSDRSGNLETPPEPEGNDEEASSQSTSNESSTAAVVISSTTPNQAEAAPQYQQQTYASVLANSQPGILYAPSIAAVPRHHPSHSHHTLRFNSEGSSLFSPSGRQLHLAYSQPSRAPYSQQIRSNAVPSTGASPIKSGGHHISISNEGLQAQIPITHQRQTQLTDNNLQQSQSQSRDESQQTAARYEAISSTTPTTATTDVRHQARGQQKYRNEQTHGALTLRSGRTYGDHRVIASTPAPSDSSAASESVQTRRIVVNHPFQTVQEVVEQEPITKYHQVTVNEPAQVNHDSLQQVQQKASYRQSAAYKVAATNNHPAAAVSYHHSGSH